MAYGNLLTNDRKELQSMALDIYECTYETHVLALLNYRYEYQIAQRLHKYCNPTRNPLRRTAQAQSVLYARPPRLTTSPDVQTAELIMSYAPNLYPTLEAAQTLTCALMDAFIWPYWDTYDNVIKLQIVPPHLVDIQMDLQTPIAIRVQTSPRNALLPHGKYRIWTRDLWWDSSIDSEIWWDPSAQRGVVVNENTLGVIPLVWFKLNPATVGKIWGIWQNQDLINGTLEIGEMETLHNKVKYLRSFRQASVNPDQFSTGAEPKAGELQIAPDSVLPFKIDSTALADEADSYLQSIRATETDLVSSRGVSAKSYYREQIGADEMGAISAELKDRWYRQIKIFNRPEKELYRIIAKLINRNTNNSIADDTDYRVDYIEPMEMFDPEAALRALESALALNVTNIEDYIYRTNPEFRNLEEVDEFITRNMDSRINTMKYLRAHNMPSDPTQIGQDPELNGANGPKLVQNSFDNNSLEFNQKANDPRGVTV